jgi:hypothetical protein
MLTKFVDGDTERHAVLGSADGRRQLLPALAVAGRGVETSNSFRGQVSQQDAGGFVVGLIDGGDEQVWLTIEFG